MKFPSYLTGQPLPVMQRSRINLAPLTEMFMRTAAQRTARAQQSSKGSTKSSEVTPKGTVGMITDWSRRKSAADSVFADAINRVGIDNVDMLMRDPNWKKALNEYNQISDPSTLAVMEREMKVFEDFRQNVDEHKVGGAYNIAAFEQGRGLRTNADWIDQMERSPDMASYAGFEMSRDMVSQEDAFKELKSVLNPDGKTQSGASAYSISSAITGSIQGDFGMPGIISNKQGVDGYDKSSNYKQREAIKNAYIPSQAVKDALHQGFLQELAAGGAMESIAGKTVGGKVISEDEAYFDRNNRPTEKYFNELGGYIERKLGEVSKSTNDYSYKTLHADSGNGFQPIKSDDAGVNAALWDLGQKATDFYSTPLVTEAVFDENADLDGNIEAMSQLLSGIAQKGGFSEKRWGKVFDPTSSDALTGNIQGQVTRDAWTPAQVTDFLANASSDDLKKLSDEMKIRGLNGDVGMLRAMGVKPGENVRRVNPKSKQLDPATSAGLAQVQKESMGMKGEGNITVSGGFLGYDNMVNIGGTWIKNPVDADFELLPTFVQDLVGPYKNMEGGHWSPSEFAMDLAKKKDIAERLKKGDPTAQDEWELYVRTLDKAPTVFGQGAIIWMEPQTFDAKIKGKSFDVAKRYQPTQQELDNVSDKEVQQFVKTAGMQLYSTGGNGRYKDTSGKIWKYDEIKKHMVEDRFAKQRSKTQAVTPTVPKSLAGSDKINLSYTIKEEGKPVTRSVELSGIDKEAWNEVVGKGYARYNTEKQRVEIGIPTFINRNDMLKNAEIGQLFQSWQITDKAMQSNPVGLTPNQLKSAMPIVK